MEKDIKWICSKCNQAFSEKNEEHHCISHMVNFHLDRCEPKFKRLFCALFESMKTIGFYEVEAGNTSILFKNNHPFLTVRFKSKYIELEFQSEKNKLDLNTNQTVQVSSERYLHKTQIKQEKDINPQLLNILNDSYKLI